MDGLREELLWLRKLCWRGTRDRVRRQKKRLLYLVMSRALLYFYNTRHLLDKDYPSATDYNGKL